MNRDEAIHNLQKHRIELVERFGVKSLALFGSVARNEARNASDVDLLVEFDERPISLFDLAGLRQRLAEVLCVENVDLVMRDSIYPALREDIFGEAIDVLTTEVGISH